MITSSKLVEFGFTKEEADRGIVEKSIRTKKGIYWIRKNGMLEYGLYFRGKKLAI